MPVALKSLSRKPKPRTPPEADPRFVKVINDLKGKAAKVKAHPTPAKKAGEAQAAAKGPANEKRAGAKEKQTDKIQEAKTKKPEANSFLALLRAEIEKAMPKTLADTENFMKGGDAPAMKGSLKGNVSQQKQEATGDTATKTKQTPDEGGVAAKPVTPIPDEPAPPAPNVNGGEAMPQPKPDAEVSLQDSKQDTDAAMADAEVTQPQMQKANDPRFSAVLATKDQVAKQADAAPKQFRAGEKGALNSAVSQSKAKAKVGAALMLGAKSKSKAGVSSKQADAKKKDEQERQQVTDRIEAIFNKTKQQVEAKLNALDGEVNTIFDSGTDAALSAMKAYVEARIDKYKDDRYSGVIGKGRWIRDQFKGLPDATKVFYTDGRNLFQKMMDVVVQRVANLVETRLREAKSLVSAGQSEIKAYVATLSPKLKGVGLEAQKKVSDQFAELERGIEDKKQQLAQSLAQKYKEAFDKADKALKEIQDANKGLVAAFIEKLGEIIKIIMEFKGKLMAVLRKGWEVIKGILADPIGFLGNLIAAIKQGIGQFVANIWTHLKAGFMKWLFGALGEAGIQIPEGLPSLPAILKLVLSVLGLTYERMRAKAVKLLGPTAVTVIEKVIEYVRALITGGPAALWEKVKEDLSSLKDMVLGAIQDWIITTIVKQATIKLLSMFNPAGAFVQACIMIYSTVMFLIERASQIMTFVEAVINSVSAIASGAIGGAAAWIERSLANAIPLVIGFLAALIGLGGISKKIKETIDKIQGVVDKAIDKAIGKVIEMVKKLFGKLSGKKGKDGKDGKDVKVTKTLSMAGESHTITAELRGGHVYVTMASGRLQELLGATAAAEAKVRPTNPQLANNLGGVYGKLKRIEEDLAAAIVNNDPELEQKLLRKISATAEQLQGIGAQYNIKNLIDLGHASQFVKDNQIKPEFRGDVFRPTFYGGWNAAAESHRRSEVTSLVKEAAKSPWAADPMHKNVKARPYVCRDANGGWTPHLADANAPRNTPLDHKTEVSTHWTNIGSKSDQQTRVTWNNLTSNLQVICLHHNSSKGGPPKTYDVAKSFRGPGE